MPKTDRLAVACPKCRSTASLRPATFEAVHKIAGRTFKGDVPARRCGDCGELLINGPAMEAFELRVALELARAGAATPDALRFMRGALGLRSGELAALLDLTPEHLSRVEHGRAAADRRTVALLASMVQDSAAGTTRTIDQLRAIERPPRGLKGTVRLAPLATAAGALVGHALGALSLGRPRKGHGSSIA
jgi:transcriptional regulator with XRE-family HTH domain